MDKLFNFFNKNKIIRFGISGAIGFFTHIIILYFLVELLNVWYLLSTSIAFIMSATVSYFIQKIFTFKHNSKHSMVQFASYLTLSIFTFSLNLLMMYVFVDILGIMYLFSQVLSSLINAFLSYVVLNKFIFSIKNLKS